MGIEFGDFMFTGDAIALSGGNVCWTNHNGGDCFSGTCFMIIDSMYNYDGLFVFELSNSTDNAPAAVTLENIPFRGEIVATVNGKTVWTGTHKNVIPQEIRKLEVYNAYIMRSGVMVFELRSGTK